MTATQLQKQAELKPTADVLRSGLWSVEQNAYPDNAGTYAIIIGASDYPHFGGGTAPASNTYGMGQLFSSAYSAYKMFEWLKTSFFITGSPVRKVWLLLSPTDAEKALIPFDMFAPATFSSIAEAIRKWYKALESVETEFATRSRSVFFFSGHGVEINTDKQVLLPSDYLSTDPPMFSDAISTYNLHLGLGLTRVPVQCFLVDACRSDVEDLRQQNAFDGAKILPEPFGGQNPKRNAPIVYATATGDSAYQSNVPEELSFFTNGLLAGLRLEGISKKGQERVAPLQPENLTGGRWGIKLAPLCEFVNAAMNEALVADKFEASDPITIGGSQKALPLVVSEILPPKRAVSMGPQDRPEPPAPQGPTVKFEQLQPVYEGGDKRFGHEPVTRFFEYAELNESDGYSWSAQPYRLENHITMVEGDGRDYRRVCFVPPKRDRWYWLRCENEWVEYGFLFPPTEHEIGPVEFAVESAVSATNRNPLKARALLSPHNQRFIATADRVWRSYAGISGSTIVESFLEQDLAVARGDIDAAMNILYEKWQSPLAATIGSMMLLRVEGDKKALQWQDNLALRVAFSSDAAIFVLQRMIQSDSFDGPKAVSLVDMIDRLGIPFTAEAFAYIANSSRGALEQIMASQLRSDIVDRIAEFNAFTQPGSLFLAVAASHASRAKGYLRDRLLGLGMAVG